ncbi:MAG: hypothetical protein AAF789_11890 [Bacteroidota bacterium]
MICPAFQSTYILDDSTRRAYFSYVWQLDEQTRNQYFAEKNIGSASSEVSAITTDSINQANSNLATLGAEKEQKIDYYAYAGEKIVPWRTPQKTKFGIVKWTPYVVKNFRLRTAPMENVLGPDPVEEVIVEAEVDSLLLQDLGDSAAVAADSTVLETFAVDEAQKKADFLYRYDPSDKFNVEQEYYNRYFAYKFIDQRPSVSKPDSLDALQKGVEPDSLEREKVPFFKRLFKKKETKIDTLAVDQQTVSESEGEEETEN